jgi:uncharacterized membrane protein
MKRLLRSVAAMLAGVVMTLACVFVLLTAVLAITRMTNPWLHALAVIGALVLGVLLLMGSVYLTTRFAVHLLGRAAATSEQTRNEVRAR